MSVGCAAYDGSMSASAEPTIFSRIVARELPATIYAETESVIAFADIAPKAPVHILVVPKTEEYSNVVELAAGDPGLLAEVVEMANSLASEHADGDFRLIFNTGAGAGQTVFHVHAHVLAGALEEGSLGTF
ncbi:histidine triad nucleotide-binding protein [soil metagenome]